VQVWKLAPGIRDNHFLDCRIYNKALAEHLGLSKLSDEDWKGLARDRGAPKSQAPLWAAATGAGTVPLAVATPDLTPAGEAGPTPARGVR
jgi:hypothetical protein